MSDTLPTKQPASECIFRCQRCGATEVYDESDGFYLVAWWAFGQRFDHQHAGCPDAPPPPAEGGAP